MKISKSKQELARIISENGGWRDGAEWAVFGTKSMAVAFISSSNGRPSYCSLRKSWPVMASSLVAEFKSEPFSNWHQSCVSRAEYFRLYPAPDADGWIEWKSPFYGSMPCDEDAEVDIKVGDEIYYRYVAKCWKHWGSATAYRLHKSEQAKAEFCEPVTRAIPGPEVKPTIEQLAADYRNAKDYADRKQQEADDAKADADEALRKLELAGEEIGVIVTPVTEKQEPELVITDWRDLRPGDEVEYVEGSQTWSIGLVGVVQRTNDDNGGSMNVRLLFGERGAGWPIKWRFIRRP